MHYEQSVNGQVIEHVRAVMMLTLAVPFLQENAYPADELMPLSCTGRWRGSEPSRGDIDDSLGK